MSEVQESPKVQEAQTVVNCCPDDVMGQFATAFVSKADLGIVTRVYHRLLGGEAVEVKVPLQSRQLVSAERPYSRQFTVGEEWRPLDLGWLKDQPLALVVIVNDEGRNLQTMPSEAERADILARVVEVGKQAAYGTGTVDSVQDFALIAPGASLPITPTSELWVRCRKGQARCTSTAVPA